MKTRNDNPWLSGIGFYEPKYYKSALSKNNIWQMDYHLARVFNTPDYCNILVQELTGHIETTKLKTLPSITNLFSENQLQSISIKLVFESLIETIDLMELSEKDYDISIKGLAWFLLATGISMHISEIEMPPQIQTQLLVLSSKLNRNTKTILFSHLIEICGSRFSAEKARDIINLVVSKINYTE